MSPALNQIRFPSDCLAGLSGGRAADSWCRELASGTQWVTAINSCDWLNELVEIDLRVSRYSLFGHSLRVLTNREPTNTGATESSAPRTPASQPVNGNPRSSKTGPTAGGERFDVSSNDAGSNRSATRSKNTWSTSVTEQVLRFQAQADISLLRRHAGRDNSLENVDSQTVKSKVQRTSDRARVSPDLRRETTPGALLARAARRAEQAWFAGAPDWRRFDRFATDTRAPSASSPSFAADWSRTVAGLRASAELLTLLANSGRRLDRRSPGLDDRERSTNSAAANSDTTAPASDSHWPEAPSASAANKHYEENQWPREGAKRALVTGVESPSRPFAADSISLLSSPLPPRAVEGIAEWPSETRLAPPTITPLPVTLRPPADPAVPVLPVAAVTARQGAKAEEAIAQGEDLTLLAARIERLLNQEARRHGIDV